MLLERNRIAAIFIFLFAAAAFAHAGTFPPQSAMFPRVVTTAMMVLAVLMFLRAGRQHDPEQGSFLRNPVNFAIAIAGSFAYVTAVSYLGYFTASVVTIPALAYLLGFRNHILIAITTALFLSVVFIVFVQIFERPLPPEFWAPY